MASLQHPRFARAFARAVPRMDRRGAAEHRSALVAGLIGRVVEVGAGTGVNFAHYPSTVTEVVAVEPDDYLRGLAVEAAARAPVPVRVVAGSADALPVETGGADAVVFSLVLCSVPSQATALAEARRALAPDGRLGFYEHVRSAHPLVAFGEDLITPIWRRVAGNCHLNRDTAAVIRDAGFRVTALERFGFAPQAGAPPVAHILGRADRG